jgi:tRNA(Arg) A34 adenosine deaminase TadA
MDDRKFYAIAKVEAKKGFAKGGIPVSIPERRGRCIWSVLIVGPQIGACVVSRDGQVLGKGCNTRVQEGSVIKQVCASVDITMTAPTVSSRLTILT